MKLIPWSQPDLKIEDRNLLVKSFDSTWISGGHYIQKFEKAYDILLLDLFIQNQKN